jgi:hypothetical protein
MRFSVSMIVLSLAALLGTGLPAAAQQDEGYGVAQSEDDGVTQTSYSPAADQAAERQQASCGCGAPQQAACGGAEHPCALATITNRFVNPGDCDPRWSFSADGVAMQRSTTRNQSLFRDINGTEDLLNSKNLDFPAAMGFQLSAVRHGPCGWDVELGYFQIDGWAANASVPGTSLLVASTDNTGALLAGFLVDDAQARYSSALHFAEINLKREWCDGLTLLAGFRLGELNEIYSAGGIGARSPVAINLENRTFNHLYGFQVGADYEFYNMGGPLRINALCKSGIYGNFAQQYSHMVEEGSSDTTLDANRNQAAFIGEAGVVATYDVTSHLSLRASFQAMWIEGVALAPEQIGATDFAQGTTTIDTHGGVFYYGGGLGAEVKF